MGLVNRKKQHQNVKPEDPSSQIDTSINRIKEDYNVIKRIIIALILSPILYVATSMLHQDAISRHTTWKEFNWTTTSNGLGILINFASDDDSGLPYNLGPHRVVVALRDRDSCKENTPIWLRIVGDALVDVPLSKSNTAEGDYWTGWTGSFSMPIEGSYKVEARWEGCEAGKDPNKEVKEYDFKVEGKAEYSPKNVGGVLFVNGAWIASNKVKTDKDISTSPSFSSQYIWVDPAKVVEGKQMTVLESREKSIVVKESVVTADTEFYEFTQLSNYEIVCWVGSKSAEDIWGSFKALRGQLFPHQRPFKFHYYPAKTFIDPDKGWSTYFRKCKHILISLDEPDKPLSQLEYKNQVTTFIKHLLNAFNEVNTFPALIWMFTTMESPIDTKNCYDTYMPRTTEHPCNDVLKDVFRSSPFPSRVRLLDNTDLTSAKMGEDRESILAATALRVFVFVGHQVKAWRDAGQVGGIQGLTKNGVTEPNYELVGYDWTQKLAE